MTLEECYELLGGSYSEVCLRLPSPRLVEKFVGKFLEDDSYRNLCSAMEAGSRPEAFRAAHTLKGVCANLSFTRLQDTASRLTELLRPESDEIPRGAEALMEEIHRDYQVTVEAIKAYQAQE